MYISAQASILKPDNLGFLQPTVGRQQWHESYFKKKSHYSTIRIYISTLLTLKNGTLLRTLKKSTLFTVLTLKKYFIIWYIIKDHQYPDTINIRSGYRKIRLSISYYKKHFTNLSRK